MLVLVVYVSFLMLQFLQLVVAYVPFLQLVLPLVLVFLVHVLRVYVVMMQDVVWHVVVE